VEGYGTDYWWGGDVSKLFKAPLRLSVSKKQPAAEAFWTYSRSDVKGCMVASLPFQP